MNKKQTWGIRSPLYGKTIEIGYISRDSKRLEIAVPLIKEIIEPDLNAYASKLNYNVKTSEFEAWSSLKGEMSWTSIMHFVRTEYLRLREVRPILVAAGSGDSIERISKPPTQPVRKKTPAEQELMKEMRKIFSEVKDIKSILKSPPKEELDRIKNDRKERVK